VNFQTENQLRAEISEVWAMLDATKTALATLQKLAQAVLDARNREALAAMTLENAANNYSQYDAEERAHVQALIETSKAERALREELAKGARHG